MTEKVPAPAQGDRALQQENPPGLLDAGARARVAAFAAANPHWDGVICIVGDPTYWVHLSAGEIISFQTFLTARLASALGAGMAADTTAIDQTFERPERLAMHLASAELGKNRDAIHGHLIGAELAAAKPYWLGQQVIVIGGSAGEAHAQALHALGVPVSRG